MINPDITKPQRRRFQASCLWLMTTAMLPDWSGRIRLLARVKVMYAVASNKSRVCTVEI